MAQVLDEVMSQGSEDRTGEKTVVSLLAHLLRRDERGYVSLAKERGRDWMPPAPNKGLKQTTRASRHVTRKGTERASCVCTDKE